MMQACARSYSAVTFGSQRYALIDEAHSVMLSWNRSTDARGELLLASTIYNRTSHSTILHYLTLSVSIALRASKSMKRSEWLRASWHSNEWPAASRHSRARD